MEFTPHHDQDTGVDSLDMDMVHDFGGQVEGLDMRDFQTTEVDDSLEDKGHLGELYQFTIASLWTEFTLY